MRQFINLWIAVLHRKYFDFLEKKQKLFFLIISFLLFNGQLFAQPGGGGGLLINNLYNNKLDSIDILTDTSLKIRTFILLDGRIYKETFMHQAFLSLNGKMRINQWCPGFGLPPSSMDIDENGYRNFASDQRMLIIYNRDTMVVDFIGIINENGAGITDGIDSLVIQKGYFNFYRRIKKGRPNSSKDFHRNRNYIKNGLTFHTLKQLTKVGYIEYSPKIDMSFLLEENLPASYYLERASYNIKNNHADSALLDIFKGIEKNGGEKDCETLFLLTDAYTKTEEYDKAIESISQAMDCKKHNYYYEDCESEAAIYKTRIDLLIKQGKYDKALEDYNTLCKISKFKRDTRIERANFKKKYLKDSSGAIKDLNKYEKLPLKRTVTTAEWEQTKGPTGGTVLCITTNKNDVFAGTLAGIFFSSNNGNSWTPINNGITDLEICCMAIKNKTIIAGSLNGDIFISKDYGSNWVRDNFKRDHKTKAIHSIKFIGNRIFVGTNYGIYVSEDDGLHWKRNLRSPIYCITNNDSNIYVGTHKYYNNRLYSDIQISKDKGNSWESINSHFKGSGVYDLVINKKKIFAGTKDSLFISSNNGNSWTEFDSLFPIKQSTGPIVNDSTIYIGIRRFGVYVSNNNGESWEKINNELYNARTNCIGMNKNTIFVGTSRGVFSYDTNKKYWESINTGLIATTIRFMAVCDSTIFAGANGMVYSSSDSGKTWKNIHSLPGNYISSFAIYNSNIIIGANNGMHLSTNNGLSWEIINKGLERPFISNIYQIITYNNKFFVCAKDLYSFNMKKKYWEKVKTGLEYKYISELAIQNFGILGLANNGIISSDDGSTWVFAKKRPPLHNINVIYKNNKNMFFAGGNGDGICISKGEKQPWSTVRSDSHYSDYVYTFVSTDDNIYVGTNRGVLVSGNINCSDWNFFKKYGNSDSNISHLPIKSLIVFGSYLITGTDRGGIWRCKINDFD